ncbi:MAG: hypothetical protein KDB27_25235, partial [Planctomycetales bacterium]|nr:hypothetical protein [Planctomycetales bacterium]
MRKLAATCTCAVVLTFSVLNAQEQRNDINGKLLSAVLVGDQDAAIEALDAGADANARSDWGLSVWAVAKRGGYQHIADLLESKGADTGFVWPPLSELIESNLGKTFTADTPACAVLVAQDGKVIYQNAFGSEN